MVEREIQSVTERKGERKWGRGRQTPQRQRVEGAGGERNRDKHNAIERQGGRKEGRECWGGGRGGERERGGVGIGMDGQQKRLIFSKRDCV